MAVLKKGSKGSAVEGLQKALNKAGAKPKLTPDGDYGKKTAGAVEGYQRGAGIKPTGVADKETQAALAGKGSGAGTATPTWTLPDPARLERDVRAEIDNVRAYDRLDWEISSDPSTEARKLVRELRHHRALYDRSAENLLWLAEFLVKAKKEVAKTAKKDPKAATKVLEKAARAYSEVDYHMPRWARAITEIQSVNKRFQKMAA